MDKTSSLSPQDSRISIDDHQVNSEMSENELKNQMEDMGHGRLQHQVSIKEEQSQQQMQLEGQLNIQGQEMQQHQGLQPIKLEDQNPDNLMVPNSELGPSPTSSTTTSGLGDLSWSSNSDSAMGSFMQYSVSKIFPQFIF